ncbi:MAG: NAD(P)H-binding protein [Hyphomonadaceae bacterium]|nr:NAD(P)H-binding protein [Hyphomonadaceae bacterium]
MSAPEAAALAGRRVFITGAGGFIGRTLVARLTAFCGAQLTLLARGRMSAPAGARVLHARLSDRARIAEALGEGDVVVHLAYDFAASEQHLLREHTAFLEACAAARVGAFVQVSSIAVYDAWPGGDLSEDSASDGGAYPYQRVKRALERRLAASGVPHTIVQPTIVYGPESPQWTVRFLDAFRAGDVIFPEDAQGLCHAVYVDDVASALIAAAAAPQRGRAYIISGDAPPTWRAFLEAHAAIAQGGTLRLAPIPFDPPQAPAARSPLAHAVREGLVALIGRTGVDQLARIAAQARRKPGAALFPDAGEAALYRARGSCAIARARAEIGYAPAIGFEEGMRRIAAWDASRRRV